MKNFLTFTALFIALITFSCSKEKLMPTPNPLGLNSLTVKAGSTKNLPCYNPNVKFTLSSYVRDEKKRSFTWTYAITDFSKIMATYGNLSSYSTTPSTYYADQTKVMNDSFGLTYSLASYDYSKGTMTIKGVANSKANYTKVVNLSKLYLRPVSLNITASKATGVAKLIMPSPPTN